MIDVTVRVDDGVDRAAVPAADHLERVLRVLPAAGVHQYQPVTSPNRGDVPDIVNRLRDCPLPGDADRFGRRERVGCEAEGVVGFDAAAVDGFFPRCSSNECVP